MTTSMKTKKVSKENGYFFFSWKQLNQRTGKHEKLQISGHGGSHGMTDNYILEILVNYKSFQMTF